MDVRFHRGRDLVKQDIVDTMFVETRLTLAELLTNPIYGLVLKVNVELLGLEKQWYRNEKLLTKVEIRR